MDRSPDLWIALLACLPAILRDCPFVLTVALWLSFPLTVAATVADFHSLPWLPPVVHHAEKRISAFRLANYAQASHSKSNSLRPDSSAISHVLAHFSLIP